MRVSRVTESSPLLKGTKEPSSSGSSGFSQIFLNTFQNMLGAGILALPWAAAGTSILGSMALVSLFAVLSFQTADMLISFAKITGTYDLVGLLERIPKYGKFFSWVGFATVTVWCWGVLVCFLVYHADTLYTFFPTFLSYPQWMMCSSVIFYLICQIEDSKYLSFTSLLGMVGGFYALGLVWVYFDVGFDVRDSQTIQISTCFFGIGPGYLTFLRVLANASITAQCVFPLYCSMKPQDRESTFNPAFRGGVIACLFLYYSFAVGGYLLVGPEVPGDIWLSLPSNSVFINIARSVFLLTSLGCFPLIMTNLLYPIRERYFSQTWDWKKRAVLTLLIEGTALVVSLTVSDFGFIIASCGFAAMWLQFLLPGVLGYFMSPSKSVRFFCACLAFLGVFLSLYGQIIGAKSFHDLLYCFV